MNLQRLALAVVCCACAVPAAAQSPSDSGVFASVALSASTIGKGTPIAISGGIGYRLTSVFGLGAEVTVVPSLTARVPGGPGIALQQLLTVPIGFEQDGGHAVVFTSNARFEWPLGSTRVRPYIIGGGGAGQVRERVRARVGLPPGACSPGLVCPQILGTTTVAIDNDSTDLALTIGGGVSVLVRGPMAIDLEARYLSLLGHRDFNVGRFGGGLTFRF